MILGYASIFGLQMAYLSQMYKFLIQILRRLQAKKSLCPLSQKMF